MLSYPHSKKVFSDVQRETPVLQFVPTASCLVPGHNRKESGNALVARSLKLFINEIPTEPSVLQAEES